MNIWIWMDSYDQMPINLWKFSFGGASWTIPFSDAQSLGSFYRYFVSKCPRCKNNDVGEMCVCVCVFFLSERGGRRSSPNSWVCRPKSCPPYSTNHQEIAMFNSRTWEKLAKKWKQLDFHRAKQTKLRKLAIVQRWFQDTWGHQAVILALAEDVSLSWKQTNRINTI